MRWLKSRFIAWQARHQLFYYYAVDAILAVVLGLMIMSPIIVRFFEER